MGPWEPQSQSIKVPDEALVKMKEENSPKGLKELFKPLQATQI